MVSYWRFHETRALCGGCSAPPCGVDNGGLKMKDIIENLISDCIIAVGFLMIALVPAVMIVGVMAIAMLI